MSKYLCPTCDKFIPADKAAIKPGDKVKFSKSVSKGQRIRITSVTGIVQSADADTCKVRYRGEVLLIPRSQLSPDDAPNPLTYAFCGTCECQSLAEAANASC